MPDSGLFSILKLRCACVLFNDRPKMEIRKSPGDRRAACFWKGPCPREGIWEKPGVLVLTTC